MDHLWYLYVNLLVFLFFPVLKWTVFPSPNGTILFSPTDDHIAGISVGNDEFSYAAIGNRGQEIKGKEVFSVKSFKLAIRLINSMNEA